MSPSRTEKDTAQRDGRVVEQIAEGLLEMPADQADHLVALRALYRRTAAQDERDEIRLVAADILGPTMARLDLENLRQEEARRKQVGQNIKRHRQALGLSQERLAAQAGLRQAHICRLEKGLHVARAKTITTLAAALNLRPVDLDPAREQ
jgi:ribosome-binding protein aMBF1 (putative translation factor)